MGSMISVTPVCNRLDSWLSSGLPPSSVVAWMPNLSAMPLGVSPRSTV